MWKNYEDGGLCSVQACNGEAKLPSRRNCDTEWIQGQEQLQLSHALVISDTCSLAPTEPVGGKLDTRYLL